MDNSFIKKAIYLLVGILVTSILFFAGISLTYDSFFKQNVIEACESTSKRWTASIDRRLDAEYEHLYDVCSYLFRKVETWEGSPEMDFSARKELQDYMESKVLISEDITALFVLDSESDLYLYFTSPTLNQTSVYNLKLFLKPFCTDHYSSLSSHSWEAIEILEEGFYYKTIKFGKYYVGAVSSCSNYRMDETVVSADEEFCFYLFSNDHLYYCQGDRELIDAFDEGRQNSYYQDGKTVSAIPLVYADASCVYIFSVTDVRIPWEMASAFMIFDSALCVILVVLLTSMLNRKVRNPIRKLVEANSILSKGNYEYHLDLNEAGSSEFEELFSSFNRMSDQIGNLTIESYDLKIKREHNRLKMLRAQMKPHTFLNAISTISNMTYTGRAEDIRKYIAAFASFTRYMLNTAGDWTTVREEISHIDNYVKMQQIRFPESIEISYEVSPEVRNSRIPYLVLFSLVENSFKHAMTLVKTMYVTITGERYEEEGFSGIRLTEEDNGPGFTNTALNELAEAVTGDPYAKEHLGLTNVRYSLNLIYGRDDLLRLSNNPEGGARIELLIPDEEADNETSGM